MNHQFTHTDEGYPNKSYLYKKKNNKNYTQGKFCVPQKLHLHFLHGKNQKRSKGQAKGKMC